MDDLIENLQKESEAILKVFSLSFKRFWLKPKCKLNDYHLSIIKPSIQYFSEEKTYLDTSSISGIMPSDYGYSVTYDNRPSRANMQPRPNSIWTAKMKSSFKILELTKFDKFICDHCLLSTGFMGVQCSGSFPLAFAFGLFSSEEFLAEKDNSSTGATMEAINNKDFLELMVPFVTPEEATEYSNRYKCLLQKLSIIREQERELEETKSHLLEKYF